MLKVVKTERGKVKTLTLKEKNKIALCKQIQDEKIAEMEIKETKRQTLIIVGFMVLYFVMIAYSVLMFLQATGDMVKYAVNEQCGYERYLIEER